MCGREWPARARKAAMALSQDIDEAEGSAVVDLLQEARQSSNLGTVSLAQTWPNT